MEESKKIETEIVFSIMHEYHMKQFVYILKYDHVKEKDFVFCCDLLELKKYDEFKKKLKDKYWNYDNGIMAMNIIKLNDVEHFKYILQYITIKEKILGLILIYCAENKLFNIVNYILDNNMLKDKIYMENAIIKSIITGSLYMVKKYGHNFKNINPLILEKALLCGDINNIKYFLNNGYKLDIKEPYDRDIYMDKCGIDKYCIATHTLVLTCWDYVFVSNNINNLNWLKGIIEVPKRINTDIIPFINKQTMQWLLDHKLNISIGNHTIQSFLRHKDIYVLKLYVDRNPQVKELFLNMDTNLYDKNKNKIDILKYMQIHNITFDIPTNTKTFKNAFRTIDVKYLRQLLLNRYNYSTDKYINNFIMNINKQMIKKLYKASQENIILNK